MLSKQDIQKYQQQIASSTQIDASAFLVKHLADPTSFKVLYILANSKYACPSDFSEILGLSLSAISHQLAKLRQMGIVTTVRHGQVICYSLSESPEAMSLKQLVHMMVKQE